MKKFFGKIKDWFVRHKPSKRRLIQVYAALLYNANIKGFISGDIYTGATKQFCVPGLNCYSCPGATGACPLGALQNALASSGTKAPFYVLGILILLGIIFGRTICGFLCPVGLGQELLYKIKTPKLKKSRYTRVLSYLKYVILVAFVVAIPLMYSLSGYTVPAFCKYICPAGTFGGAIGLLINPSNAGLYDLLGSLFTWKFAVLCVIVVASIFIFRVFCRFLCPLGAIYGFFSKIALLGIKLDKNKCTNCGLCVNACKMDIKKVGDHECIQCGECISVCPSKAISWKGSKLFLHVNAVEPAAPTEEKPLGALLQNGKMLKESAPSAALAESVSFSESAAEAEPAAKTAMSAEEMRYEAALVRVKRRNFWLQVAAAIFMGLTLIASFVYYNFIDAGAATVGSQVGNICPDFTVSVYGEDRAEYSVTDSRGTVTVINFWATWCGPCVAEIPYFEELKQKYGDEVEVIAIQGEADTDDVPAFIAARGWDEYAITFAQDNLDGHTCLTYTLLGGRSTWPMTLVLDKDGIIRYNSSASIKNVGQLEALIAPYLTK